MDRLVSDYPHNAWGYSTLLMCWWFLWPALHARDAPRWKVFFWSAFLVDLFQGLDAVFLGWMGIGRIISISVINLLPAAILLGCVWIDRQVPVRRPWTHWAGVLAFLWGNLLHAVTLGLVVLGSYF